MKLNIQKMFRKIKQAYQNDQIAETELKGRI